MELEGFYSFLAQRLVSTDALLIDRVVIDGQIASARVIKAYTSKHEGSLKYNTGEISFVGTPGNWGNPTLSPNDKAVAFIGYIENSKGYYQYNWLAHFLIFEQNGCEYALPTWNTNGSNWWPTVFHDQCIVPDSSRHWRVAVPFALFEEHLFQVINRTVA